jgi:hypothetical protein
MSVRSVFVLVSVALAHVEACTDDNDSPHQTTGTIWPPPGISSVRITEYAGTS